MPPTTDSIPKRLIMTQRGFDTRACRYARAGWATESTNPQKPQKRLITMNTMTPVTFCAYPFCWMEYDLLLGPTNRKCH